MGLVNITCRSCGEPMWIETVLDAIFDVLPNSPEMRRLFAFKAEGINHVWECWGCGRFEPILGGRVRPVRAV